MNNIDFKLAGNLGLSMIQSWLPDGRQEGDEWVCKNPTRSDAHLGSFRINLTNGKWSDFATGDTGGDAVSFLAYIRGIKQYEAAHIILGDTSNHKEKSKKKKERPIPNIITPYMLKELENFILWKERKTSSKCTKKYFYHNKNNEIVLVVTRFDNENGKDIAPFYGTIDDKIKMGNPFTANRPLYNLSEILNNREARISISMVQISGADHILHQFFLFFARGTFSEAGQK